MDWYIAVLKKYAVFEGRARRKEFWYFNLFALIITIALRFLGDLIGISFLDELYLLFILIPSIAVLVRRLHDTGRSGWWVLVNFIPIIGWIVLIVFAVQEGTPGENQYGFNPKQIVA